MDSQYSSIRFKLLSIEDKEFKENLTGKDLSSMSPDELQFMWKVATEINLSVCQISILTGIKYKYHDDELVTLHVIYIYDVPELKDFVTVDSETDSITFQVDILPTLVGASYSATRGIMHERIKGSELVHYPVPMISMDVLMSKNGLSLSE